MKSGPDNKVVIPLQRPINQITFQPFKKKRTEGSTPSGVLKIPILDI